MMAHTLIVNHSHLDPNWRWLEGSFGAPDFAWEHFTSYDQGWFSGDRPPRAWFGRCLAAYKAVRASERADRGVFVSHGPRPAMYASWIAAMRGHRLQPHLVFSFNFTTLPSGRRRKQMTDAFRSIDRFAVYSSLEKDLYAEYFGIPGEKVDFIPFAVAPPRLDDTIVLPIAQPYVCAIGSQGRDYALLFAAARALPSVQFCVIAYSASIAGLDVPANVKVLQGVSFNFAAQVAANAEFMVLPLISGTTPCGHVTTVMAMQVNCPMIATDSIGLHDYLRDGDTAQLIEPRNLDAMVEAIRQGVEDPGRLIANGERAKAFTLQHCTENVTIDYFRKVIAEFEKDGRLIKSR